MDLYLHGSCFTIAYKWRPPLNCNWLREWDSTVRLISRQVLQAAGVSLFLPLFSGQRMLKIMWLLSVYNNYMAKLSILGMYRN